MPVSALGGSRARTLAEFVAAAADGAATSDRSFSMSDEDAAVPLKLKGDAGSVDVLVLADDAECIGCVGGVRAKCWSPELPVSAELIRGVDDDDTACDNECVTLEGDEP